MSGTRGGSNDAALPLIATEEIGGEQYQKIKIVNGAAGETAAIGGDATNGLDVDVTRVSGTVTVGATDLDIRALDSGTDSVSVTGSVSASVSGTVTSDAGTGPWPVTDNDGSLTVDGAVTVSATDLDIRGLNSSGDSVQIVAQCDEAESQVLLQSTPDGFLKVETRQRSATAAVSSVDASATSVTIMAYMFGRTGATVYNDSTEALYLDLSGGVATTSSFTVKIAPGGYYEVPFSYIGIVTGLWDSATGHARVTQISLV